MKVLLIVAMSAIVIGCGGSSSNSGAPDAQEDPTNPVVSAPVESPDNPNNPITPPTTSEPEVDPSTPIVVEPVAPPQTPSEPPPTTPPEESPSVTLDQLQVLISDGGPAPGIEGAEMAGIFDVSMANNGWVAAYGDYVLDGERTAAIWRGRYGELSKVLEVNDSIVGYASNIWVGRITSIVVTDDSTVWAFIQLGGAGNNEAAIIRIDPDGTANASIRSGENLAGAAAGTTVERIDLMLAGGGDAAYAVVNVTGNWHHMVHLKKTGNTLVISTNTSDVVGPASLVEVFNNCHFRGINIANANRVFVSPAGAVLFKIQRSTNPEGLCPNEAYVQYLDGSYSIHLQSDQVLPVTDGAYIRAMNPVQFMSDNTALFSIYAQSEESLFDANNVSRYSLWLTSAVEPPRIVALSGETLPPAFTDIIEDFPFPSQDTRFSAVSKDRLAILFPLANGDGLYVGSSRPDNAVESIANPNASQLNYVIAENTETVPGLGERSYFSEIFNLSMNETGQIWFLANANEGSQQSDDYTGLYRLDTGGTPMLEIGLNTEVPLSTGESETFRSFNWYDSNNDGDWVLSAVSSSGVKRILFRRGQ